MDDLDNRQAAVERIKKRRDFRSHLVVFTLVMTLLVVIWAASGAGYFWPIWPFVGWGAALVAHSWAVYGQQSITEDDIRQEMQRNSSPGS